jgi:hypothetical protein
VGDHLLDRMGASGAAVTAAQATYAAPAVGTTAASS